MPKEKFKKIKILDFSYDEEKNLIKLKIQDLEDNNKIDWMLSGSDFDSLINQITNKSLIFSPEQRKKLGKVIIDKQFVNVVKVEIKDPISKENIESYHKILDKYPYQEILINLEKTTDEN